MTTELRSEPRVTLLVREVVIFPDFSNTTVDSATAVQKRLFSGTILKKYFLLTFSNSIGRTHFKSFPAVQKRLWNDSWNAKQPFSLA